MQSGINTSSYLKMIELLLLLGGKLEVAAAWLWKSNEGMIFLLSYRERIIESCREIKIKHRHYALVSLRAGQVS